MKLNKAKCNFLPLGWGTSKYKYRLGETGWCSPKEKDLRVLGNEELPMT